MLLAHPQVGLPGAGNDLEQRLGAGVGTGLDVDDAALALVRAGRRWQRGTGEGAPGRRTTAVADVLHRDRARFRHHRTALGALEGLLDVDARLAGPQRDGADEHRDTDGDEEPDDHLRGHGSHRGRTVAVAVACVRVRGIRSSAASRRLLGDCLRTHDRVVGRLPVTL